MSQEAREGALGKRGGPTFHFGQVGLGFGLRECVSTKGGASFREGVSFRES
jgi:hypothetical protein